MDTTTTVVLGGGEAFFSARLGHSFEMRDRAGRVGQRGAEVSMGGL